MAKYFSLFILLLSGYLSTDAQSVYISHGIAADDHKQKKSLENAIDLGFAGISVDLHLKKDGSLKCGSFDLQDDYLEKLQKIILTNSGRVYKGNEAEFILILKVDNNDNEIITKLEEALQPFVEILTNNSSDLINKKAVRIVLANERSQPFENITKSSYLFLEEPFDNVSKNDNRPFNGLSGLYYKKIYDWKGSGAMPNMQYHSFSSLIKVSHKAGKKVRIHSFPEVENAFDLFLSAGADYLEVKDLKAFEKYYRQKKTF